jgi:tetratricopeptide (TPR) repeat protein
VELLEQIENGELDAVCTPDDWNQICQFLVYLARQGMMPGETEINKAVLEVDIQEMMTPSSLILGSSYFLGSKEFSIVPAVYYGEMNAMICRGWLGKQWKQVKSFVKHHKTAVIIGAVLVVAAVAIVVTVTVASSTAAAAAAAAAAGSSDPHISKEKPQQQQIGEDVSSSESAPSVEEQISVLKSVVDRSDLLPSDAAETVLFKDDNGRVIGSTLAHEVFDTISSDPSFSGHSEILDKMILSGHGTIDNAFSTDQSIHYLDSEPSFEEIPWEKNIYHQLGEQSLKLGDYELAIENFGKAIEKDPQNHEAYLQRAYAYMGSEDYDQSLNDYRTYITCESSRPKPSILSNTVDFSIGFVQNVPRGAVESGRQLTTFASDLITHPIDTSGSVCSAFATLAQLACTQQWAALSESIAPEVCQLANEWNGLTAREQGERAGYIFGKYGGDILIPGATAKVLSKGIDGAKNMVLAAKNLQNAEQVFALEGLAQSAFNAGVLKEAPVQFKNADRIECGVKEVAAPNYERILQDQVLLESYKKFQKAQEFLKPFQGRYLPEPQIKELIHQSGIPTFSRPRGIPENFRVTLSDKGAGIKYVHPDNEGIHVRVMPGKPHSSNPCQQKPYVSQVKNGQSLDKYGNIVNKKSPEAHIPIDEFVYREF